MYRNGPVYDEIKKVIIDIYLDYDIKNFPIDPQEVCRKLGAILNPYSNYGTKERCLLLKKSEYGFFAPETPLNPPSIFYNDSYDSLGAQRLSIFHELKHYVFDDKDDKNDDLADFFARFFLCPIPYLLLKNIVTPSEVALFCGVSNEAACNASSNLENRKQKYGYQLFEYEIPLIEHLEPGLIDVYSNYVS